jgi:hypothetical protein
VRRIKNGSTEPYSRFDEIWSNRFTADAAMLDNPEKTARLMIAMTAALPFEVELTSSTIAYLRTQHIAYNVKPIQTVSKVSYAGDEGGILCHLQPEDTENVIIVSLTHVRMRRSLPLAAAVFDYQKHRLKKLKKQGSA